MRAVLSRFVIAALMLPGIAFSQGAEEPPRVERYGTFVSALKGRTIEFPDFKLTYLGQPKQESGVPVVVHQYELEGASGKVVIQWASVGNIAPHHFCFGGNSYSLELLHSEKLGDLAPYEIVIWKLPEDRCKGRPDGNG